MVRQVRPNLAYAASSAVEGHDLASIFIATQRLGAASGIRARTDAGYFLAGSFAASTYVVEDGPVPVICKTTCSFVIAKCATLGGSV